MPGLNQVE